MNEDFIQKLMVSKAIMQKHNEIPRGKSAAETPQLEEFQSQGTKYNIPSELMGESMNSEPLMSIPTSKKDLTSYNTDAVKNSKLPDAIKKLMLENPIQQPQQPSVTLSDELIEKASKLMGTKKAVEPIKESKVNSSSNIDYRQLSKLVKESVKEILEQNGLLVESVEKTNDVFSFRVGSHVFEGKVTKVKKIK